MRKLLCLIIVAILPFIVNCAGSGWGPNSPKNPNLYKGSFSRSDFNVPVVLNEHTAKWLDFYQKRGRKHFARHLNRSYRYIPQMKKILKEHGLPTDLVYIALIESGFNAKAHSHANAVGFWQFISATGRRYDLKINRHVDERRDFVKATHAAARYLKDLHNMFGHWYLAASGYNAGEGTIMRAIKKTGSKDFWTLADSKYLRSETKNYIPKYLAAMIIAKNPERFGYDNLEPQAPLEYETIQVRGNPVDLRVAAKLLKRDKAELETLNPELKLGMTPPNRKSYALRVPSGQGGRMRSKLASMPKHLRMAQREHHVVAGETLESLAKQNNMSLKYFAMANGMSAKSSLKPGQRIGIPFKPPRDMWRYKGSGKSGVYYHRVRAGDSLWKIAQRYKVPMRKLRKWNKGKIGKHLKPGQKIALRGSKNKYQKKASQSKTVVASKSKRSGKTVKYRVKSGDSLWTIASAHGVSISELKSWNQGTLKKHLKPGQRLVIKGAGNTKVKSSQSVIVASNANTSKTKKSTGNYKVQSGDSLWTIAQKNKVSVSQLKKWNEGNIGRHLKPGQRIKIVKSGSASQSKPRTNAAKPTTVAKAESTPAISTATKQKTIMHKISSGDTLWDIARKYGVSTRDIKKWNGIDQVKRLRPGNRLKIYVKRAATPSKA